MSKSNVKIAPALKPRSSLIAPVSQTCWYAMHDPSATVLSDKFGNGPDFTFAAGAADALGRNAPSAPNTTIYATAPADAYLYALLSMVAFSGQLLIAFDYESSSAAIGASASFFTAGQIKLNASSPGGVQIYANNAEQLAMVMRATNDVSNSAAMVSSAAAGFASTERTACVIEMIPNADGLSVDVYVYFSTASTEYNVGPFNVSTTGAVKGVSAPYGTATDTGYTIGARRGNTATYDQYFNGTAGDGGAMQNLILMRRVTRNAALGPVVAQQMRDYPNEWPAILNAA